MFTSRVSKRSSRVARRGLGFGFTLAVWSLGCASTASAQAGGAIPPDSVVTEEGAPVTNGWPAVRPNPLREGPPLYVTLGMAYGQRFDPCAQCASPENLDSFSAHAQLGRYVWPGLALGVAASVWRRGHPGTPTAPDPEDDPQPTKLVNQLGNASLILTWETGRVFMHAGAGVSLGWQDIQDEGGVVTRATGIGTGYTMGAGAKVPLVSMVSLVFFANWNAGTYDLATPFEVVERDVRHELFEVGFGLSTR